MGEMKSLYAVLRVLVDESSKTSLMVGPGICKYARSEPAQHYLSRELASPATILCIPCLLLCTSLVESQLWTQSCLISAAKS